MYSPGYGTMNGGWDAGYGTMQGMHSGAKMLGAPATAADFGIAAVDAAKNIATSIVTANTPQAPRVQVPMSPRVVPRQPSFIERYKWPLGIGAAAVSVGLLYVLSK